jgi:glycosyltransferase involved in cell wall biosynthesis
MENTFFTVFTSVYNRKHTIHRVWESLINQTHANFEWILINNGSVDGVEPLLEKYKTKANFPVKIFNQENKGKYMAFDRAVDMAEGELFIPADSDDTFEFNTLERFNEIWNQYKAENVSGITVLCKYDDGNIVGEEFPFEGLSTYKDIVYKHQVDGEKWGCIRVDLLKRYRFPKTFDVKYFPDFYVWAQIGFNYKTVFINESLRLYYQDSGNQITNEKNLSVEFMRMKNYLTIWTINYIFPEVEKYIPLKEYLRKFVFLWITTFRSKTSVVSVLKGIKRRKSKIVALLLLAPSFLIKVFNIRLDFLKKEKYRYQQ